MVIDPHCSSGGRLALTFATDPVRDNPILDTPTTNLLKGLGAVFTTAIHGQSLPILSPNAPNGASISGQVFQDNNGNGLHDSGENGQPGVTVYIDANHNSRLDKTEPRTLTDSRGDYWFTGLRAGNYTVREVVPAGWTTTTPAAVTLPLAANQQANGPRFGIFKPGSITGHVFIDNNGNGILDQGDVPQSRVPVYLDANGNGKLDRGERSTLTGPTGAYSFTNLKAGTYTLREVLPAGWMQTQPAAGSYSVVITSGLAVTADFANFKNSSLSGQVLTTTGVPLPGVTVYLDANNNGQLDSGERSLVVGSQGTFSFTGLRPGTYIVREIVPVGWNLASPTSAAYYVTTTSGLQATGLIFYHFLQNQNNNVTDTVFSSGQYIPGQVY
jgi:protocatechuate 3,4-dioxygenase beta subunit